MISRCDRGFVRKVSLTQMRLGKRQWNDLRWVLTHKETYVALLRTWWIVKQPLRTLLREIFATSLDRPDLSVRTPLGPLKIHLRSAVDLSTVFGVFCREDYAPPEGARVVVDVGANIGIATLFFLSRNREAFVYAYEPVHENVEAFRRNVEPFCERCELEEIAVAPQTGMVDFGVEPTGKFGGMRLASGRRIRVRCLAINEVLEGVVSKHGEVDCLKLDVEGSEREILQSLDRSLWKRIRCIYAESSDSRAFMPSDFVRTLRYNVERLAPG
jgi:FkbM family methyltransferase